MTTYITQDVLVRAGQGLIRDPGLAPNLVFGLQCCISFSSLNIGQDDSLLCGPVHVVLGAKNLLNDPSLNTSYSQAVWKICLFTRWSRRTDTELHHWQMAWNAYYGPLTVLSVGESRKQTQAPGLPGEMENKKGHAEISNGISEIPTIKQSDEKQSVCVLR